MPELPEVETTLRGLKPWLLGTTITKVEVRQPALRWPVVGNLSDLLDGEVIMSISRRAKYLLMDLQRGSLLIHLGMSGSLRLLSANEGWRKHDHIEMVLHTGKRIRYHDPRRFGSWSWTANDHHQLANLGPEPLSTQFNGDHLYRLARGRKVPVKNFIMLSTIVVGVGNIYASESLFRAGIRPDRSAGRISLQRYQALAHQIKAVLAKAIEQGGTTLRDFVDSDGEPGYFKQQLQVYGRHGQRCFACKATLKIQRLGQRSTVFCSRCQT
ncbi:MAG: DNA-formamidopyrimidine glycosylase [Cellvibrionales bacterium TMED49]|nr:DNA-formamidopyrimidine glycosylase [Porticoccaceae bacterium]OUU38655.1 MAG: DNA-formamidopyrimidine glycosylase [Cellvibrionales bacterium TMED49]